MLSEALLELQSADTLAEQLRYRKGHLPEREALDAARRSLSELESRRNALLERSAELDAAIERSEAESHQIDTHKARLDKQLKTVIAPREAEALMHEIALLNERRSGLDDAELEALEEQAGLDDTLASMSAEHDARLEAVAGAQQAADVADAAIDSELADLASRQASLRAAVDATILDRYDRLRAHHTVAAARLQGHRCEGCSLDLAAAEVDEVRAAAAANGIGDCPQCGRMLIVA